MLLFPNLLLFVLKLIPSHCGWAAMSESFRRWYSFLYFFLPWPNVRILITYLDTKRTIGIFRILFCICTPTDRQLSIGCSLFAPKFCLRPWRTPLWKVISVLNLETLKCFVEVIIGIVKLACLISLNSENLLIRLRGRRESSPGRFLLYVVI